MLRRVCHQRPRCGHVLLQANELEDGSSHEEVDLAGVAAAELEFGQHLSAAGAVAAVKEVLAGLGIPKKGIHIYYFKN